MHLDFGPRGILQIDDVRLAYKNFSGAESKFNRKGDRNFSVIIPNEEIANALIEEGWNVKIKAPREEGDVPFIHLPVKVKFYDREDEETDRGPYCYLITGNNKVRLNEDTIGCLDDIWIESIRLDIRPYDWEINGKQGRTAYLHGIEVTQAIEDRFGYYED